MTTKQQAPDPRTALRSIGEVGPRYREWSLHPRAHEYISSPAKRGVVKSGRRGAKTQATAEKIVRYFLRGRRVTYGTPTSEQLDTCWRECKRILQPLIDAGILKKNETEHIIEREGTEQRLHCKTIFNADTMRGTYGDLFLDEWQLCDETAWTEVGAPMLLDYDGDAWFIFTPPSPHASGISRARDPLHATKLFAHAQEEERRAREEGRIPRWQTFHWTSHDNGYISQVALEEITLDMSREAYRREILAEDDDISPNLLIYRAFNEASQLIEPFLVPETWPRYVGHDFGGANPAALFFAQDPATGYFYAYHEYFPGRGLSTYQHVLAFKELTKGLTVLKRAGGSHQEDEIRQGYTAQGWPIQEPKILNVNARIDRVRAMMEKNQVFVFKTLTRFRQEIATYLWKQDADGRITDEIDNKSAYHLCFAAGTLVRTLKGEKPIETLKVGDLIATRDGYFPALACAETQHDTPIMEARFSDDTILHVTPEHPFWVKGKGFVPLDTMAYGDIMSTWSANPLSSRASSFIATPKPSDGMIGCTLPGRANTFIGRFGRMLSGRFQKGMSFITETATRSTIPWTIWNVSRRGRTCLTTCMRFLSPPKGAPTWRPSALFPWPGIAQVRAASGIGSTEGGLLSIRSHVPVSASSAKVSFTQSASVKADIVREGARLQHGMPLALITKSGSALFAKASSRLTGTREHEHARGNAVRFLGASPAGRSTVYNLVVEDVHEYYANGILVSNCDAMAYILSDFTPERAPAPRREHPVRISMAQF